MGKPMFENLACIRAYPLFELLQMPVATAIGGVDSVVSWVQKFYKESEVKNSKQ